ncbi:MAG: hypothetical protein GF387_01070 [Candidatus Portnoybacteria bacterium]|nr:hypothetical protein [Candidatus Portnoybacteria bacterium]
MKKIIIIIIVLIIVLGAILFLTNKSEEISEPEETAPTHEEAELTGYNFMLGFVKITPSSSDPEAEKSIYNALSENAKEEVSKETIASDLAQFIGVQDVPDQGVSVEDLQIIDNNNAILIVGLNYSGGRTIRHIHLVIENNEWKVDKITIPEDETVQFDQTGNLARNNPGMEEDTWYLIYEQPGQPALTDPLVFTSSSICAKGNENTTCDPEELTQGDRVRILGEETEQGIKVIRLEQK